MFGAAILGLTTPLRVCTVSACGRNGGQAFCDAVQTLSAGTDLVGEVPVVDSCHSVLAAQRVRSAAAVKVQCERSR